MHNLLILCGLLLAQGIANAKERLIEGIIIEFKPNTSLTQRNTLHDKFRTDLYYRSKIFNLDHVTPKYHAAFKDLNSLNTLCEGYIRQKVVATCSINQWTNTREFRKQKSPPEILNAEINCPDGQLTTDIGLDTQYKNGLFPLWAQWHVGSDLVSKELDKLAWVSRRVVSVIDAGFDLKNVDRLPAKSLIENLDRPRGLASLKKRKLPSHFASHGSKVANLINGKSLASSQRNGAFFGLHSAPTVAELIEVSENLILNTPPHIVNLSIDVPATFRSIFKKVLKTFAAHDFIVVRAATDPKFSNAVEKWVINVGHVDTKGFPNFRAKNTLYAPSGDWLVSFLNEKPSLLSGSSGAAALVSASLGLALENLPKLSLKEAKALLVRSSSPVELSNVQSLALLNAYRAFEVSMRLQPNWPKNRAEIQKKSIYKFNNQSKHLYSQALSNLSSSECKTQQKAFEDLRKSYLLDPTNLKIQEALRSIYILQGLSENAAIF